MMSLHGAGVEAINQTGSYAPKHWAYVIARRTDALWL